MIKIVIHALVFFLSLSIYFLENRKSSKEKKRKKSFLTAILITGLLQGAASIQGYIEFQLQINNKTTCQSNYSLDLASSATNFGMLSTLIGAGLSALGKTPLISAPTATLIGTGVGIGVGVLFKYYTEHEYYLNCLLKENLKPIESVKNTMNPEIQ